MYIKQDKASQIQGMNGPDMEVTTLKLFSFGSGCVSFPCIAGNSSVKECYEHHLFSVSVQLGHVQADSKGFHFNHSQSISTLMSFITFFYLKFKKNNPKQ